MLRNRHHVMFVIALVWSVIFILVLLISRSLYSSSFANLEINYALDSNNRAYHSVLSELKHIHILNTDYAFWNDTYNYLMGTNPKYEADNLVKDLFTDNNIDYVLLLDKNKKFKWHKFFDRKISKLRNTPKTLKVFLQKNIDKILATNNNLIYGIVEHGHIGFWQDPISKNILYISINMMRLH